MTALLQYFFCPQFSCKILWGEPIWTVVDTRQGGSGKCGTSQKSSWEMFHCMFVTPTCSFTFPKNTWNWKQPKVEVGWAKWGGLCSPLLVPSCTSRCNKTTSTIQRMVFSTAEVELTPCAHSKIWLNIQVHFLGECCHFMFIPDSSECFFGGGEISCKKPTASKEKVEIDKY